MKEQIKKVINRGRDYLLSQFVDGFCVDAFSLRHGPSLGWTTACAISTLAELSAVPKGAIKAIISLQTKEGGWSYNGSVPPDADTTLRVMQCRRKVGLGDTGALQNGECFVLRHQQKDGGFATFTQDAVEGMMGYGLSEGWTSSHPCVTALAMSQITDPLALAHATRYIQNHLKTYGPKAYWWISEYYIRYELDIPAEVPLTLAGCDSIELGLMIMLQAKHNMYRANIVCELLSHQRGNGSFFPSRQLRVPYPYQRFQDLDGSERVVEDERGILSTCAAIVALHRASKLMRA